MPAPERAIRDEPGNGHRHALPAEYIAGGNVAVHYDSTISGAQGATVDEAHVIIDDRTNSTRLYVGATRGRRGKHIHAAPPAFDLDEHGPAERGTEWAPTGAVTAALERQPDDDSAIARRRQLRELSPRSPERRAPDANEAPMEADPGDAANERVAAAMRRFQRFGRRPTQGLGR